MNVLDAAYHTVHDYPGGAPALAMRMGRQPARLSNEVRPPLGSTHKLGLLDAVKLMELTGDQRILDAIALQMGQLVVPLPGDESAPCAVHTAEVARRFAHLMHEVVADTADGRISDNELRRIEREWGELVASGRQLLAHLKAVNLAGRPDARG